MTSYLLISGKIQPPAKSLRAFTAADVIQTKFIELIRAAVPSRLHIHPCKIVAVLFFEIDREHLRDVFGHNISRLFTKIFASYLI